VEWSDVVGSYVLSACYLLLCLLVVERSDVVGSYVLSYSYRLLLAFMLASNVLGGATEFCSSSRFFLIPILLFA
jgi:hypothetical protein